MGWEVSDRLRAAGIAHAIVEGDCLGQVHPAPAGDPHCSAITEANLTAMWRNFAALGHHRLVCTNTVSVLSGSAPCSSGRWVLELTGWWEPGEER